MTDLLRLIVELLQPLWPLRIVWQWQRGCYFVGGKCWGVVGPGLKLVVPYVCDVKAVSIVPEIYTTPLQTITLQDNKTTLTFSASITVIVTDPFLAYNRLGHYSETVVELAASVLSQGFMIAELDGFDASEGRLLQLLEDERLSINKAVNPFGLDVTALRLNNFVRGARTIRLLLDHAVVGDPLAKPNLL